jgi:hypothetical protein
LIWFIATYLFLVKYAFAGVSKLNSLEHRDSFPEIILDSIYLKSNLKYDIYLAPLSEIPLFNPIDGFLIQTNIGASIKLNNPVALSFRPRYAFHRKYFYGDADFSFFLYKKEKSSTLFIMSGGNFLNQVNEPFRKNEQTISILNVLKENNPLLFIERKFLKLHVKQYFLKNISLTLSSEFAHRSYLNNYPFKYFNFLPNKPIGNYDLRDKSFLHTLQFSYSPLFTISYKKGVKGFLKSESDFDFVQLEISHAIKLNKMARVDFSLLSGRFLTQNFIHFNDFYHFPTGRTLKSSHPIISTFRLLDYYNFSTNNYFHRIHFQAQAQNLLLSRLPFLKKGKNLENIFVNVAITDRLKPFFEVGYALDHVFKKFRLEIVTGRLDGKWLGPRIILGPVSL